MGHRTVKRVPLDFQWPMHQVWSGYTCPFECEICPVCNGSGHNPETRQIDNDFYDFAGTGRKWDDKITEDEVAALLEHNRLSDFTRKGVTPTAEMVNEWHRGRGFGHDGINRWILVETRAKRLGVYGRCANCGGGGELWDSPETRAASEAWEPTEPPVGEGWQLWETVSEGSPISPVFKTAETLAEWCESNATLFASERVTRASWLQMFLAESVDMGSMFISRPGYVGTVANDPEAAHA